MDHFVLVVRQEKERKIHYKKKKEKTKANIRKKKLI